VNFLNFYFFAPEAQWGCCAARYGYKNCIRFLSNLIYIIIAIFVAPTPHCASWERIK
jgi:hypothetical protein